MKQVLIIGNGVSGITAARHIRKLSDHNITVISSETPFFFSRTALMYVYMGHLTFENIKPYEDWFWKKNRIELILDHAQSVDCTAKSVRFQSGKNISYDILVIATGSLSNSLNIPGKDLMGVQALYNVQDLRTMETNTRNISHAVIVGGGLIGVEMAEMLHSRKIHVTMLIRERAFWNNVLPMQEAQMISRHIASHGIEIRHEHELAEIISNGKETVQSVRSSTGEEIPCEFAGIAVGVHPNVAWLTNSPIRVKQGVLVNEYLETNIPDVYAVGDCVERLNTLDGRKNIEQVWYTARMMGETVAQTICGHKTPYNPGPWFNSAKFFDIEYQAYGTVSNVLEEDEDDLYWEHHSGRKAIHAVWNKYTNEFIGINSFGIRLRHERMDRWLREKRSIGFVLEHLAEANFDPEFSERHEKEIRDEFSRKSVTDRIVK